MEEATKALESGTRVKAAPGQMTSDLAGEAAILNMKTGIYFGLNAVGARVWELIQEPTTVAQVRDAIVAEYDAPPAVVEADIKGLLGQMAGHGLIEVVE